MATPIATFTKTPTEQRWLTVDWSGVVFPAGVDIASVTWDSTPAGLTLSGGYVLGRTSYIHIAAGVDAMTYVLTATLTSSETPPTKIERAFSIVIAA